MPGDHATIQEAIDAAFDGATVCVAPGTYTGSIAFHGRAITVQGTDGAAATILDGGGTGPVVVFWQGEGPESVLSDVTVTGGNADEGAGIYVEESSPTLRRLIVTGNTCEASSCLGTGIYLSRSAAVLQDAEIAGNVQAPTATTSALAKGAGLHAYGSQLTLEGVYVHDNLQMAVGPLTAGLYGAGMYFDQYDQVGASDLVVEDNAAEFSSGATGGAFGIGVYSGYGERITWEGGGIDGNGIRGSGGLGLAYGGGLFSSSDSSVTLAHVSITSNFAAGDDARGGGIYAFNTGLALTNVWVAGNTVTATTQGSGGGIYLVADQRICSTQLTNVDVTGNRADAPTVTGVGIANSNWCDTTLLNVSLVGNASSSTVLTGGALSNREDGTVSISFSNIWGNASPEVSGVTDPVGSGGNVAVDPLYTDLSAAEPAAWDLHLGAGSPLIDAGDRRILDADGSPSDVGAYGGAYGDW